MKEFEILTSPLNPGLSVIEASAGTGKTYVLSHLVPRLLLDETVGSLGEILLLTFTKDAAREMSARVRKVLETLCAPPQGEESETLAALRRDAAQKGKEGILVKALLDIDQLQVSTIHSFCQQILQSEGVLCGLPVVPELLADTRGIVEEVLHEIWEREMGRSEILSTLVVSQGWSFAEDRRSIEQYLVEENADFIPEVSAMEDEVKRLETLSAQFDEVFIGELQRLFSQVKAWNKIAPDQEERERILRTLRRTDRGVDLEFLQAAAKIAEASSWIKKLGKEAQSLSDSIAKSDAVRIGSEIGDLVKKLHWVFWIKCLRETREKVGVRLAKLRQIDYDGLIDRLHKALKHGPKKDELASRLRKRFKIALIDESQDTDLRQMDIFRAVFLGDTDHRLILIGDPKQAIYGFRGADVNTYLDAKGMVPEASVFGLTKTYRAPQPLVEAWNALFARPRSLRKDGLDCAPASSGIEGDVLLELNGEAQSSRMEFWIVPDADQASYGNKGNRLSLIAKQTASEIVRILESGKIMHFDNLGNRIGEAKEVRPGDFAVLVRKNEEAKVLEEELKERKVPSVRSGAEDVMATEEASDLLVILQALEEPRRKKLRFRALATRLLGRTDKNLRELAESEDGMLTQFLRWQEVSERSGPAVVLSLIDREEGMVSALSKGKDGDRRITNFRQLCDVLQTAYEAQGGSMGKLVLWFSGEIGRAQGRQAPEERLMQLERDAEAVRIVTMHKAKGLEYPLVFCPFLWSSISANGIKKLAQHDAKSFLVEPGLCDDETTAALEMAELEEGVRLAYVAVTRAKVKVWIHAGELCGKTSRVSALDWLLAANPDSNYDTEKKGAQGIGRGIRHEEGVLKLKGDAAISFREPPEVNLEPWSGGGARDDFDFTPVPTPKIPSAWWLTSFSSLTREKNRHGGGMEIGSHGDLSEKTSAQLPSNPFLHAPGGTIMGTAVHDWIQDWDFGAVDVLEISRHLERYSLPKPKREDAPTGEAMAVMLEILRGAVLSGFDCTVAEACPEPKASEWQFYLPIRKEVPLDTMALAQAFAEYPQVGFEDYPNYLADINAAELYGYLHGFLDRVAKLPGEERWGVIDWKTNNLGDSMDDYDEASLRKCAMGSHYFLQVHLYLVALRRHLGTMVGDAWLVFLRGLSPESDHGILHVRPPVELLEALDQLFFKL